MQYEQILLKTAGVELYCKLTDDSVVRRKLKCCNIIMVV